MFQVAECYRNHDKLWHDGPLRKYAEFGGGIPTDLSIIPCGLTMMLLLLLIFRQDHMQDPAYFKDLLEKTIHCDLKVHVYNYPKL